MALKGINDVDGRFINMASSFWWAYRIAFSFNLDPREVKQWDSDEVMEALAAIGLRDKHTPKPNMPKVPKGG